MANKIQIRKISELNDAQKMKIFRRAEGEIGEVMKVARKIVEEVRDDGDIAILEHLRKYDNTSFSNAADFEQKLDAEAFTNINLRAETKTAIRHALANIVSHHAWQKRDEFALQEVEQGVFAGEKWTPIANIGLYVPRGKGSFPSVMCMLLAPALLAGSRRIVICTPPDEHGNIDSASLYTVKCALEIVAEKSKNKNKSELKIFKIGGASAIAAMALGTGSVPKVDKILGPGNPYCVAAKRLLADEADMGTPAGPSEAIILADENADAHKVALDLCIEAEHGSDSSALLVTWSQDLAEKVAEITPNFVSDLPSPRREFCQNSLIDSESGGIYLATDEAHAVEFCNQYAVEHLQIHARDYLRLAMMIENAGEILLGENTPISLGNYCIGVNAILPTGARARTHSCVSLDSFMKKTSLAMCTAEALQNLKETAIELADFEGFPAHARALRKR